MNVAISPATSRLAAQPVRAAVVQSIALAIACLISYELITQLLAHVYSLSASDDRLGGMWAVIATIFVYRFSYEESVAAAVSRMAATLVSFVLCLVYLLFLPFHVWGMAALIGVGALIMTLVDRPRDAATTGITTAVVMVVAALSPHNAWEQPILRWLIQWPESPSASRQPGSACARQICVVGRSHRDVDPPWPGRAAAQHGVSTVFGVALVLCGALLLVLAYWRYRRLPATP